MKKKRDILIYLEDIADSAGLVQEYISDISEFEFYELNEKQDAVLRRIQVIGEAAKHIPDDYRNKWNHIPWKEIAGMRDILVHEYFGITFTMVWKVVNEDLPILKEQVEKLISEIKSQTR